MPKTMTQSNALATPAFNADEVRKFLGLFNDDEVALVAIALQRVQGVQGVQGRTFKLPADTDAAVAWARDMNAALANMYLHVNRVEPGFAGAKAKKEHIAAARFVVVDLDPREGEPYAAERERLLGLVPKLREAGARAVVDSGNGVQAWFKLADPVPLQGDPGALERVEQVNIGLAEAFGGDPAVHNVDRVLRLPGTVNYANPTKMRRGYPPRTQSRVLRVELHGACSDLDALARQYPAQAKPEPAEPPRPAGTYSADEVTDMLRHIDPGLHRQREKPADEPGWANVLAGVHHELGEAGLPLVLAWSRGDLHGGRRPENYDSADDVRAVFHSFKRSDGALDTIGTVIRLAREGGWRPRSEDPRVAFKEFFDKPANEQMAKAGDATALGGRPQGTAPFTLLDGNEVTRVDIDWLWKYRIARGHLTVLLGDMKAGKTMVVESLMARRTRGEPLPGDPPVSAAKPGRWALLESEDDENDTTTPRLDAAGAVPSGYTILNRASGAVNLSDPVHLKWLEYYLREKGDVEALVVSPVNNFLGGNFDSYNDVEVRAKLQGLVALAKRLNIAVILILHLNKDTKKKALHRGLGSVAYTAIARTVLLVAKAKDGQRYVAMAGSNSKDAAALRFDIQSSPEKPDIGVVEWQPGMFEGLDADDLLAEEREGRPPEKLQQAMSFLDREVPPGKSASVVRLTAQADALGIKERTLRNAARALNIPKAQPVRDPDSAA